MSRPEADHLRRLALSVVLPGFTGTSLPGWLGDRLAEGLAGACLFGENVESPEQVAGLAGELHRARPGVLVASDEEGGSVTRLHARTGSPWPGHATLGALDDERATYAMAHGLGSEAAGAGIDLVLAPVVDVSSEPDNPVIGVRSFGSDPDLVARHGVAFVRGLQDAGVLACVKHYPGHGATRTDSHLALPVLDVDGDTWRRRDLAPFVAAVQAGAASVMTAHVVVSSVDERPATLSPVHLRLLRDELGFAGLVVSDALDMQAISARVGRAQGAVLALAAGVDLLCVGNPLNGYDEEAAVEEIVAAVQDAVEGGRLSLTRLQEASRRVAVARNGRRPAARLVAEDPVAVARRALRVHGDVGLRGPAQVLVTRSAESVAAGPMPSALVSLLGERRPDWPVREVHDPGQARAAVAGAAGEVLVVVEGRPDPVHAAVVAAVLEQVPDAVMVYGGLPTPDDRGERTVHTYGTGRATAAAAADLLLPNTLSAPAGVPAGVDVDRLATEQVRADLHDLDERPPGDLVELLLEAEATVPEALAAARPALVAAVGLAAQALGEGGRLLYVGAGTPGRLAALDAAECPPTFGTAPDRVVAVLAGGQGADRRAVEGAEDDEAAAARDLTELAPGPLDLVVGITASGRTPYVLAALETAHAAGARTVAVVNNPASPASRRADVTVELLTGPEVLSGSTRLKAGTSQKVALNVVSTAAMVLAGKTYGGWMADVVASNEKLRRRARRILREATGVDDERAVAALEAADWHTKTALVALLAGVEPGPARALLDRAGGRVRRAIEEGTS